MISLTIFLFFYFIKLIYNYQLLYSIHYIILIVLLLTTIGSICLYILYDLINQNGNNLLYSKLIIISFIIQMFQQIINKILLLLIWMGYGIIKIKLMTKEWLYISLLFIILLIVCKFISFTNLFYNVFSFVCFLIDLIPKLLEITKYYHISDIKSQYSVISIQMLINIILIILTVRSFEATKK